MELYITSQIRHLHKWALEVGYSETASSDSIYQKMPLQIHALYDRHETSTLEPTPKHSLAWILHIAHGVDGLP